MNVFWDSYGIVRGPSGIFVHARELRRSLSKHGVEVSILGASAGFSATNKRFLRFAEKSKVLGPQINFREFSRALPTSKRPAIYHGLSNINLPLWTGHTPLVDVRFVVTVHDLIPLLVQRGGVSLALRAQIKALLPWVLKRADAVVAVSMWTKNTLAERYPEWADKIFVIPNGFPPAKLSLRQARKNGTPLRVLTVGRNEKYKRHDLFLNILLAGSGKLHGTIVTTNLSPAEKKLANHLIAQGWLQIIDSPSNEALQEIYQENDVYLQTSLLEGFCLPAAESQAYGTPVVFTLGSGIDEVVCPSTGRGLLATAETQEWLDAVVMTADRFAGQAENLQRWVTSRPTWDDSAIQLKTLYNSL